MNTTIGIDGNEIPLNRCVNIEPREFCVRISIKDTEGELAHIYVEPEVACDIAQNLIQVALSVNTDLRGIRG